MNLEVLPVLLGIFVTAFVVGLSGAMMPGPMLAVTISQSSRRGAIAGPLLVLGHMLLEAALVAAVVFGFARFLKSNMVTAVISLAGGVLMGWMGQGMIRSAGGLSLRAGPDQEKGMHPVVAGMVVSLSNPYWTIWWATIGITYLIMGMRHGLTGLIVFFAGHIMSDLAWFSFVSVSVAKGGRLLPDKVYRGAITACGVALIAFGMWFLWDGGRRIAGRETLSGERISARPDGSLEEDEAVQTRH